MCTDFDPFSMDTCCGRIRKARHRVVRHSEEV